MTLFTKDQLDAARYVEVFSASSFEERLIQLLVVSDRWNTQKIMDAWGDEITRMADGYRRWHKHKGVSPEEFER